MVTITWGLRVAVTWEVQLRSWHDSAENVEGVVCHQGKKVELLSASVPCWANEEKKIKMPVERMRMRPWLEEQINESTIPGLKWLNEELKIFQIPWMHAARHGWDVEKDAPLFRNWAIHTGKYQPGVDKADPKTWKANFRCAMNSLPDIEEVKDKSIKKGNNAYRVYRMLPLSERSTKKAKKPKIDGNQEKQVPTIFIKQEQVDSTFQETNGVCQTTYGYVAPGTDIKNEVDSTVNIIVVGSPHSSLEEHMIVVNPPDVCQVVEVTTESEEQNAGRIQHYPLQISPAHSYAESETDSVPSDEDRITAAAARLLWEMHNTAEKPLQCNPGSRGTDSLPSTPSFTTANKPDLQVTIKEESCPTPYNSTWPKFPETRPGAQVGTSASTSSKPDRASVIKKTSDVAQPRVKSC